MSCVFMLFWSLCLVFKTQVPCFQQNPASFCRTPGVGGTTANFPNEINNIQALGLTACRRAPRSHPLIRTFGLSEIPSRPAGKRGTCKFLRDAFSPRRHDNPLAGHAHRRVA